MNRRSLTLIGVLGLGATALLASQLLQTKEVPQTSVTKADRHSPDRSAVTNDLARFLASAKAQEDLPPEEVAARKAISQGIEAQPIEVQRQFYEVQLSHSSEQIAPTIAQLNRLFQSPDSHEEDIAFLQRIVDEHNERVTKYAAAYAALPPK